MVYKVSEKKRRKFMNNMNKIRHLENGYFHFMHLLDVFMPILVLLIIVFFDIKLYTRNVLAWYVILGEIIIILATKWLFHDLAVNSTSEPYNTKEESLEFLKDGFKYSYLDTNIEHDREIVTIAVSYKIIESFEYNETTGFIRMIGNFPYTYYKNGHISAKEVLHEIVMVNDFEVDFVKHCRKHGIKVKTMKS